MNIGVDNLQKHYKYCYNYIMSNQLIRGRQEKAIEYYTNPKSDSFGVIRSSCLKAGYSKMYVKDIYLNKPEWLTNTIKKNVQRIKRSEKKLDNILSVDIDLESADKLALDKIKLQADIAKFVVKSLASGKYKSNDNEDVSRGSFNINIVNYTDKKQKEPIDVEVS